MLGGNDEPIWVLRTRTREVIFCRVSGSGPSAVFSRCKAVSSVKLPNFAGNGPATRHRRRVSTLPTRTRSIKRTGRITASDDFEVLERGEIRELGGKRCGDSREGELSTSTSQLRLDYKDMRNTYRDETRPVPSQRTPVQVQNLMSLTQPPASSAVCPS